MKNETSLFTRYLLVAALMCLLIAGMTSCGKDTAVKDNREIKIAVSQTPLSAPFLVAEHLGLFSDVGLNVAIVPCYGGVKCAKMLLSNNVDYATASESVAMFNSFKHPELRLLVSFVESSNDLKLLTLLPHGIGSIAELKGRKVGVVKGSASEFYLDRKSVV